MAAAPVMRDLLQRLSWIAIAPSDTGVERGEMHLQLIESELLDRALIRAIPFL